MESIHMTHINWFAIIVVTLLSFMLGALWHSPFLFGKTWARETNRDSSQKGNFLQLFGLSAIAHLAATIALAAFIGSNSNALSGLRDGLVISIFWISTSIAVTYLFANRSVKLFLIDAGFYVVFFSLAGMIIGAWQ